MNLKDYDPEQVKTARRRKGLTQQSAARHLRVASNSVSRVELGQFASFEILKRMALLYGVSVKKWIYDTPEKKSFDLPENSTLGVDILQQM